MSAPVDPAASPTCTVGARDTVAVIVAYVPFGLTVGAAMANAHVPLLVAWSSSPLMFGGAGQLLAVQLLGAGAGAAVAVLAALVVNARFLLYSAALAPHVGDWPRRGVGRRPTCSPTRCTRWSPPGSRHRAVPEGPGSAWPTTRASA